MRILRNNLVRSCPVLLAVIFFSSCDKKQGEEGKDLSVRPVKLLTIAAADTVQSSRYPAVIDAVQSSELSFQVGGLLKELPVKESQQVNKGDLIAQLDQRDFNSQVDAAQAQFDNAEEEFQRAERLAKEDAIARSVLEQRKTQRDVTKAQLDSAKKALADTELRAPFSGVIAKISTAKLQTIQPGQVVAILMGSGIFEAKINLPARIIAQSRMREEKGAYVLLDAAPDRRIEATFKEATLVADATSQTYAVTFTFEPAEDLIILPGMNATVELKSSAKTESGGNNRVSVPLAAVMSDGNVQHVWVINKDTMKVSKRSVTIEAGIGDLLIVTEGLTPGETIAGAGASYLAEGMQVRPWTD